MTTTQASRLTPEQQVAARRWKLGHHVFHLYLVAMNTRVEDAADRLEREDWEGLADALDDLARLYDAATSGMRYASEFRQTEYERLVRPSMMPPFVSRGFSGVFNLDHARMLGGVKRLRAAAEEHLGRAPVSLERALGRLAVAHQENRDNHSLVCTKFVPDGESLLREFYKERKVARHGRVSKFWTGG